MNQVKIEDKLNELRDIRFQRSLTTEAKLAAVVDMAAEELARRLRDHAASQSVSDLLNMLKTAADELAVRNGTAY